MNVKSQGLNNKGFSLIELMVVVGIIGILATVAVPQVTKFMAKAKQSEAKTNLASIYTSNKSYLVEYDGYTNEFGRMGYSPEGTLTYNLGFAVGATVKGPKDSIANINTGTIPYASQESAAGYCGIQEATGADTTAGAANPGTSPTCRTLPINGVLANGVSAISAAATVTANTFLVEADGMIVNNSVSTDQWTMNESKQLINTVSGLQ